MDKWQVYVESKRLFDAGENVTAALRDKVAPDEKRLLIEAVYDLQSGSYTSAYAADPQSEYQRYMRGLFARTFADLNVDEVLDCGIGEATSWLRQGPDAARMIRGFDVSLSRLSYADANLASLGTGYELFSADLHDIPIASNAGGCVVTMHAIEPNGGMEGRIVDELVRVSSRYLVIMEPDFSQATDAQRERMQRLGYALDIFPHLLRRKDIEVRSYQNLEVNNNPLNCASLLVAEKKQPEPKAFSYASPITGTRLRKEPGFYYDSEAGSAFPIIRGIPALKRSDAVFLGRPHPSFCGRQSE